MNTVEDLVALNPFPGLRSYATNEADRFFGRRRQIQELADKLATVSFVAVAGSSGCGKSSLVRAGLLNELSSRTETGARRYGAPLSCGRGFNQSPIWRSRLVR